MLLEAFARSRRAPGSGSRSSATARPRRASPQRPARRPLPRRAAGDELAEIYASADVFCFPSTTDTFGQVILEAAASGLPAVAAAAGGGLELVLPGETGLLVPPDDPVAFMHALAELAENDTLRVALGARALGSARARSWTEADSELIAGYAAAVASTPPVESRASWRSSSSPASAPARPSTATP